MLAPPFAIAAPAPAPDARVAALAEMFPGMERDLLETILAHHGGDIDKVVAMLLTDAGAGDPAGDADAELARRMQLEVDGQVAAALHKEIQEELGPAADPMRAMSSSLSTAVGSTKKLLQRARERARTLTSTAKMGSSHSVRLLDATADPAEAHMEPIASPLYLPPVPMAAEAPAPAEALVPPALPAREASDRLYSSRVGRARASNANRSRSGDCHLQALNTVDVSDTVPVAAPAAAPLVPVGDLI